MSETLVKSGEIQQAFKEYDRQVILNNIYIGCLIGVVLMPLGTLLDYFIYHDQAVFFLKLRLLCSLLIGLFWLVVKTPLRQPASPRIRRAAGHFSGVLHFRDGL